MLIHRTLKIVAALLILDVIAVYAYCLSIKGHYPPSHPWSGTTLILCSAVLILQLRRLQKLSAAEERFRVEMFGAAALMVVAAVFWTVAALAAPSYR